MGIDMKAFMKPELKDRGTMEFPGIERYKDAKGNVIPFIIKRLSMKEIKEIRNNYKTREVYRDKRNGDRPIIGNNGQVAVINDYDGDSAGLEIMVEAFVQPKSPHSCRYLYRPSQQGYPEAFGLLPKVRPYPQVLT